MSGRDLRAADFARAAALPFRVGWDFLSTLSLVTVRAWRWWGSLAVIGAFLLSAHTWTLPPSFLSEGTLTVTPRFLLEGYMLATQELTRHYAARLSAAERVQRAMRETGTATQPIVIAEGRPGMAISLRVQHPEREMAERMARTLMIDLRNEIESENRARAERDRLDVELSLTSFARPSTGPWWRRAGTGAVAGGGIGLISALLRAWLARDRLISERDARQSIAVPVLGVIPRQ